MHIENFKYCDSPTIETESPRSQIDRLIDDKPKIMCIENAWIIPFSEEWYSIQGQVINEDGTIVDNVCSESVYPMQKVETSMFNNCEYEDSVIYLGGLILCWGHYFTDGLSKLWCFFDSFIQNLISQKIPIVFVAEWKNNAQMPKHWQSIIDHVAGESINIIPLKNLTKYKKIYIPSNTIQNTKRGRFYTSDFSSLCNILTDNVLRAFKQHNDINKYSTFDKIYLSRTKLLSDHAEFGEKPIEKLFAKAGYHIVYPELLSFEEQVWLLNNAKEVVATMGSISHNFLFCKPKTDVVILRKAWYTNDFQYVINQVSELNVMYIDVHLSVFINENSNEGPFYLYINNNLVRFFQNKYNIQIKEQFNRRLFQSYVMNVLSKPYFNKRNIAPKYYFEKMSQELNNHLPMVKIVYRKLLSILRGKSVCLLKHIVKKITR